MIADTEARKIAASWHGGGGTALYAFASTGAIDTARPDHDIAREINGCIQEERQFSNEPDARPDIQRDILTDLDDLMAYVRQHGPRGPVTEREAPMGTKYRVLIDVSGGVAYVAECPPEIEVIIRDYDNCYRDDDEQPDYCPER